MSSPKPEQLIPASLAVTAPVVARCMSEGMLEWMVQETLRSLCPAVITLNGQQGVRLSKQSLAHAAGYYWLYDERMTNSDSLQDKVVLVTGGARGIGAACCKSLAAEGAKVVVNYRQRADAAEKVVEEIQAAGGNAIALQADVTCDDQVKQMLATIRQELGTIDVLINNAGIFEIIAHDDITMEKWQEMLDVNLTGTYRVTWAITPEMIEQSSGVIINISSIAGLRPRPNSIAYAVTKAGMIAMTKGLAQALAPHNIRVNAVAPGLIDTDIIADVDEALKQELIQQTPIPRLGTPEDIAEVVRFLASSDSSFMTGQTLVASGGRVTLP